VVGFSSRRDPFCREFHAPATVLAPVRTPPLHKMRRPGPLEQTTAELPEMCYHFPGTDRYRTTDRPQISQKSFCKAPIFYYPYYSSRATNCPRLVR
jgi:hypothetical protein